ncbi:MAG: cytochrome c [Chloroflexi bacterium]|nr:cytochrome c [Chloroflexota bacterium]
MPTSNPRRLRRACLAALAAAVLALVVACTGDERAPDPTETPTVAATTEATPTPTPTSTSPPTVPRFSGTDGRALYGQACAVCHGQALEGTNAGPTFLNRIYAPGHHADISFIFAVERGVRAHHWDFGNMAPVEGLEHEQVLAIIAFIREQQRAAGIE